MTLNRLICACYNVFPGVTKIEVVSTLGKKLYLGLWNDGCIKNFGSLTVINFAIDELKNNGVAKTIKAWVVEEDNNEA